jgi:gas vesicle protein
VVERSEVIRSDIAGTRAQLGDTLDALSYKANVPARTKDWAGHKKDAVTRVCATGVSKVSGATDSMVSKVFGLTPSGSEIEASAGRVKDTAERNPIGLMLAGAGLGFLTGLLAPSTRIENEKLGPAADQVKSQAVDVGQETLEHSKQIAQDAVQSAVDTVKEEGKQHGEELSSTLREKGRELTPGVVETGARRDIHAGQTKTTRG